MISRDVKTIVEYLLAAFPHTKTDPDKTTQIWTTSLREISRLVVARAAMRIVESNKYYPQLRDVMARVRAIELENWWPPADPQDEACMWYCFQQGHCDPTLLSDAEVRKFYGEPE